MKLFVFVLFFVCSTVFAQTGATRNLYALFDEEWEANLRENPTFASFLGDKRYNTQWDDVSLAAINKRNLHQTETLARITRINRAELSDKDKLNYDLFKKDLEESIEGFKFKSFLLPIKHDSGIQTADQLAEFIQFQTVKDYEDWLARLNAFPVYIDQTIALLREGQKQKILWARVVMERVPPQIDKQITATPEANSFYAPFKTFPKDISEAEQTRLKNAAKEAITNNIIPSYKKLKEYFVKDYLPASYPEAGVWQRPDGADYYEAWQAQRG